MIFIDDTSCEKDSKDFFIIQFKNWFMVHDIRHNVSPWSPLDDHQASFKYVLFVNEL